MKVETPSNKDHTHYRRPAVYSTIGLPAERISISSDEQPIQEHYHPIDESTKDSRNVYTNRRRPPPVVPRKPRQFRSKSLELNHNHRTRLPPDVVRDNLANSNTNQMPAVRAYQPLNPNTVDYLGLYSSPVSSLCDDQQPVYHYIARNV